MPAPQGFGAEGTLWTEKQTSLSGLPGEFSIFRFAICTLLKSRSAKNVFGSAGPVKRLEAWKEHIPLSSTAFGSAYFHVTPVGN